MPQIEPGQEAKASAVDLLGWNATPEVPEPLRARLYYNSSDNTVHVIDSAGTDILTGGGGAVSAVFGRTGAVVAAPGDYSVSQITGAAPLDSPAFIGIPTAPTQSPNDSTTALATTEYVDDAVAAAPFPTITDLGGVNIVAPANNEVLTYDTSSGFWENKPASATQLPIVLSGGTDAIDPHTSATYIVDSAGVDSMTIVAPTVTTDDGKIIKFTTNTAPSHTITFTGGCLRSGSAGVTTATFAAFAGSSVQIMAWQGNWYVIAQNLMASFS